MQLTPAARRRWTGSIALAGALAMLVVGQILLKRRLSDLAFLVYWMICFLLTGLAMAMALLDMRAVRNRTRQEQRRLLETTIEQIQADARTKQQRDGPENPKSEVRSPNEIRRPNR